MEIVIAAALLAIALVAAARLYGRHPAPPAQPAAAPAAADPARLDGLAEREARLSQGERDLAVARTAFRERDEARRAELERISGLTAAQAKQLLLKDVADQTRHEAARTIRQIEEETKRDADRRVRNILSVCMQRVAAGHAAETTVSGGPALLRRHEGPHHRARGAEHPRAREPHRRRLHHRRHPQRGRPLGLRRRPPRGRPHDARAPAGRRPRAPGADRGDVLPGQVRPRDPYRRARGAGRVRGRRAGARPRAGQVPRPPAVPHELRAERARALDRGARSSRR